MAEADGVATMVCQTRCQCKFSDVENWNSNLTYAVDGAQDSRGHNSGGRSGAKSVSQGLGIHAG